MAERALAREDIPSTLSPAAPIRATVPLGTGMDDLHELRVRIPVNLHRQLLSLKVLRGRSLADTVSVALDQYFAQVKGPASDEEPDEN